MDEDYIFMKKIIDIYPHHPTKEEMIEYKNFFEAYLNLPHMESYRTYYNTKPIHGYLTNRIELYEWVYEMHVYKYGKESCPTINHFHNKYKTNTKSTISPCNLFGIVLVCMTVIFLYKRSNEVNNETVYKSY